MYIMHFAVKTINMLLSLTDAGRPKPKEIEYYNSQGQTQKSNIRNVISNDN